MGTSHHKRLWKILLLDEMVGNTSVADKKICGAIGNSVIQEDGRDVAFEGLRAHYLNQ
jgi:hypothetical protein